MKKIKLIAVLAIVVSGCLIAFFTTRETKAEVCAKCTGSANCRACSSCNYCAHCNSGGSCGVCSSSSSPAPTYTTPKPKKESSSSESETDSSSETTSSDIYKVNSQTLNIRSKPSLDGSVVYTLKFGSKLTVLSFVDAKWAKVRYTNITGYAYRQYLIK